MSAANVLVVDDHEAVVEWLLEELTGESYSVRGCTSAREALALLDSAEGAPLDILIADIEMPGMRGLDLMEQVHLRRPGLPVILITAFGSVELAVRSVRAGASDFVTKPFTIEVLILAMERALRERHMRGEIVRLRKSATGDSVDGIVARSVAMRKVLERASRAARTSSSVLITGETGTGKGTIAAYIHSKSQRRGGPFVQVNCSTLPAGLAESELFGSRRGAFTDAREDREGLFARSNGGTLFLDEVGELPMDVQPKLLLAVETGRFRPLGATKEQTSDVRIIAATNRRLEEAVQERRFRDDLLFRLDVIRIAIPPLRERPEDLEPLTDYFLDRVGARLGHPKLGITRDGMRWLGAHSWPGNIRELSNVIERAIAFSEGDTLTLADFVDEPPSQGEARPTRTLAEAASAGASLEQVEMAYIHAVIDGCCGNLSEAARKLGIDRRTLHRKLENTRG